MKKSISFFKFCVFYSFLFSEKIFIRNVLIGIGHRTLVYTFWTLKTTLLVDIVFMRIKSTMRYKKHSALFAFVRGFKSVYDNRVQSMCTFDWVFYVHMNYSELLIVNLKLFGSQVYAYCYIIFLNSPSSKKIQWKFKWYHPYMILYFFRPKGHLFWRFG